MKIEYNMIDNYKTIYNESMGIFRDIKKIKTNDKITVKERK